MFIIQFDGFKLIRYVFIAAMILAVIHDAWK